MRGSTQNCLFLSRRLSDDKRTDQSGAVETPVVTVSVGRQQTIVSPLADLPLAYFAEASEIPHREGVIGPFDPGRRTRLLDYPPLLLGQRLVKSLNVREPQLALVLQELPLSRRSRALTCAFQKSMLSLRYPLGSEALRPTSNEQAVCVD